VKQIPSGPAKMSEIIELFLRDNFFEMLSKETNLYYFQNQGNYDSSSKGVEMGGCKCCLCNLQKRVKLGTYVSSA
jgi:hypothetical protein